MSEDGEQEKEVARQRVESAVAELRAALSAMRGCKRSYTAFDLKMTEQLLALLDGAADIDDPLYSRIYALEDEINECNQGVCYKTGAEIDALVDEYHYLVEWMELHGK